MKDYEDPQNEVEQSVFDALQHASRCIENAVDDQKFTESMTCAMEGIWFASRMEMRGKGRTVTTPA